LICPILEYHDHKYDQLYYLYNVP